MNDNLFLSILAMDAYNRGPGNRRDPSLGSIVSSSKVGKATLIYESDSDDQDDYGYSSVAYSWNGKKIIAYRGTDDTDIFQDTSDIWNGWTTGGGFIGTQAQLALETYTQVTGKSVTVADTSVILTGQSLGGALAGFVSAVSGTNGVLFDHMAFTDAAYAKAALLGSALHTDKQNAFYVEGDILALNRIHDLTPNYQVPTYETAILAQSEFTSPIWVNGFYMHQPETMVIMMFGDTETTSTAWNSATPYFLSKLFDHQVMDAVSGLTPDNSSNPAYYPYYNQRMLGAIAYSALDKATDVNLVYGDTAIRALYNDASDLGGAIDAGNFSFLTFSVKNAFGLLIDQFAGKMAFDKIQENALAREGVLHFDQNAFSVVVSDKIWNTYGEITPDNDIRLGIGSITSDFLNKAGFSQDDVNSDPNKLSSWQVKSTSLPSYRAALTNLGRLSTDETARSFGAFVFVSDTNTGLNIGENWNAIQEDDIIGVIGTDSDNLIIGSSYDEIILSGAGQDDLVGGGGNNILDGGSNIDTADYSSQVSSGITINSSESVGGVGTYTVDHSPDGSKDYLFNIEKIVGTSLSDTLKINQTENSMVLKSVDLGGQGSGSSTGDAIDARNVIGRVTIDLRDSLNQRVLTPGGNQLGPEIIQNAEAAIGGIYDDVLYTREEGGQLWGGGGNDILFGGSGSDLLSAGQYTNGGVGPVNTDSHATLIGGEGTDYLANGVMMEGGKGNDIIDARGWENRLGRSVVKFAAGDGHDVVLDDGVQDVHGENDNANSLYSIDGIEYVDLTAFSLNDVKFVWDVQETYSYNDDVNHYASGYGDLAIVMSTGDSILFQNVAGNYRYPLGQGEFPSFNQHIYELGIPNLLFSDGRYLNIGDGVLNIPVIKGNTAAYSEAIANWTAITSVVTSGTDGDDAMTGSSGNDPLTGGAGNDQFGLSGGHDYLDGGSGNDRLNLAGTRNAYRFAVSRKGLTITANNSSEGSANLVDIESFSFAGEESVRSLADAVETDIILGTAAANILVGTSDQDQFLALDGDDDISGSAGDDVINGGDGYDLARFSGTSSDYRLGWKDGWVSIEDLRSGTSDGNDLLTEVEGFHFSGVPETLHIADLVAAGSAAADTITGTARADRIEGREGDDSLTGGLGNDVLAGGAGNDTLNGGEGDDIFEFAAEDDGYDAVVGGDGLDRITAVQDGAMIGLSSIAGVEEISANGHQNVTVRFSGSDDILDLGAFAITGAETIDLGAGSDTVSISSNSVSVTPGAGNDQILATGEGDTIIRFAKGDGHDILQNPDVNASRNDTLFLIDTLPDDITLTSSGDALTVTIISTGDSFTVAQQFAVAGSAAQYGLSQIKFADGSTLGRNAFVPNNIPSNPGGGQSSGTGNPDLIVGGGGADTIDPLGGNDRIVAGPGNDVIQESIGNDTYVWSPGEGDDLISGGGSWDGVNTIEFGPGVTAQDLRYGYADGQGFGLKISVAGQTGSITIDYQFLGSAEERIDQFRFADGSTLSRQQFQNAALAQLATAGNDTLWGSQARDVIQGGSA